MTSAETLREHAKSAVTLLAELASEEDRKYLLALARIRRVDQGSRGGREEEQRHHPRPRPASNGETQAGGG
jgi:hypothetical protein